MSAGPFAWITKAKPVWTMSHSICSATQTQRLRLWGNASTTEKGGTKIASERAVNTKAYLVGEKGIDSSRVAVYTGTGSEMTVITVLIPSGATFDSAGDVLVDESGGEGTSCQNIPEKPKVGNLDLNFPGKVQAAIPQRIAA